MSELSALEIVMNAQINFESVAKMNPALKLHPIFALATEQLENGIAKLKKEAGWPDELVHIRS